MAKACGGKVKQQHVWWWLNKSGGRVPSRYAPVIVAACRELEPDSDISCEALCPDFPWGAASATAEGEAA